MDFCLSIPHDILTSSDEASPLDPHLPLVVASTPNDTCSGTPSEFTHTLYPSIEPKPTVPVAFILYTVVTVADMKYDFVTLVVPCVVARYQR